MTKTHTRQPALAPQHQLLSEQSAIALLTATFDFLRRNNIPDKTILDCARQHRLRQKNKAQIKAYKTTMRDYEGMGVLMATWYSQPQFVDKTGHPLPLTIAPGPRSIANLIRASNIRLTTTTALQLMRHSTSVKLNNDGTITAQRRVFTPPQFELPRAAFIIERYLDTLLRNTTKKTKARTTLLIERSAHVTGIDLSTIVPILRDIKDSGKTYIDTIDGEIEASRLRRPKRKGAGELGVLIFAWTR